MSAQRSVQCARALLRALQKEPARVARTANLAAAGTRVAASDLQAAGSFQKFRWASAASPLPKHAAPEPCPTMHTASFSTDAASPSVSGKPGAAPGGPSDDAATTVAGSEEKDEPIKPPLTGDGKGGTGVRQDLVKENEELLGLLSHQEALLEEKDRALMEAKDKLLRSYAEMENLRDRTRREAESTRKYSIQDFAKSLLDIADNLGRALETVRKSESSAAAADADADADAEANAKLLKSLLEGVEMTDKQLIKVFEKHGLERFNPEGDDFDPNEHQAVFEVEDGTKTPGTVAVVLKSGYKLHDRVIRPAVVGVVKAKSE